MKYARVREWWRFWRHPLLGLNPYGWIKIQDINIDALNDGDEIEVINYPNGAGGKYRFDKSYFGEYEDGEGVYIGPPDDGGKGVWVKRYGVWMPEKWLQGE